MPIFADKTWGINKCFDLKVVKDDPYMQIYRDLVSFGIKGTSQFNQHYYAQLV